MEKINVKESLLERFVRYASVGTQSNSVQADAGVIPSTACQWDLARMVCAELKDLGLFCEIDAHCYVYAFLPASEGLEDVPCIGFCSHLDTASDAPGDPVHPRVHRNYDGKKIMLEDGFFIDHAELAHCVGDTIITSDGRTLLGADDKIGIAGIITLVEYLLQHPEIKHGPLEVLFTPDEETGHGMDFVPLDKLKSKAFYTIDGSARGVIEGECFNAYKTVVDFTGVAAHLGMARGRMVNAVTMATAFINALPAQESPEATDGYFGFFCPFHLEAGIETARLTLFIRDFCATSMRARLQRLEQIGKAVEAQFPNGKVKVTHTEQYKNMKEKLNEHPQVFALLEKAVTASGLTPRVLPIRGGTDGSKLTQLGIPTPNIFTGGYNYHSRTEWASLNTMHDMFCTVLNLTKLWAEEFSH